MTIIVKKIFLLVIVLHGFIHSTCAQGEKLFDDSFLHEIHFFNMDTSLLDGSKIYQMTDMSVDGQFIDSIGIREKGNISRNVPYLKVPLKVKLNKYVSGRKYDGIKEFTLHNNYQDPTMLREKLSYEICSELGLYALRTAFAKVYIDGRYWGLYTLVEGKDEMFRQRFGKRDADAIESLDFGNMCFISNNPQDYNLEVAGFPYYQIENGDPTTAFGNFAEMIDVANHTPDDNYTEEVSQYLNLEHFFRYQAANVFLMNFDSYIAYNGNQIYMYDPESYIWQVIPWDFNGSLNLYDNGNGVQYANSYPLIPARISEGCIAGKLTSVASLKDYYLKAMCELIHTYADTSTIFKRIDLLKGQIQEAVYADRRKMYSNQDFDRTTEYGHFTLDYNEFEGLKTFFTDRYILVKQSLENMNYNCHGPGTSIDPEKDCSFRLYPCPSGGILNIEPDQEIDHLLVLDIYGREVMQMDHPEFPQDLGALDAGTYIITLRNTDASYTSVIILY